MTLFHLWNLPGDVLAAPESASGLDRCNISLSLSLSLSFTQTARSTTKCAACKATFQALPHLMQCRERGPRGGGLCLFTPAEQCTPAEAKRERNREKLKCWSDLDNGEVPRAENTGAVLAEEKPELSIHSQARAGPPPRCRRRPPLARSPLARRHSCEAGPRRAPRAWPPARS